MPNWCENRVTISGDEEVIKEFRKVMEGPDHHGTESIFSFNQLLPMPVELINTTSPPTIKATQAEVAEHNNTDVAVQNRTQAVTQVTVDALKEKYGACDWYSWATNFWGTKWQPTKIELDAETDYLVYHFDTAGLPKVMMYDLYNGHTLNLGQYLNDKVLTSG